MRTAESNAVWTESFCDTQLILLIITQIFIPLFFFLIWFNLIQCELLNSHWHAYQAKLDFYFFELAAKIFSYEFLWLCFCWNNNLWNLLVWIFYCLFHDFYFSCFSHAHTQVYIVLRSGKSHQESIGLGAKASGAKFNFRPQVRTFANPSSVTTSTVPMQGTTSAGKHFHEKVKWMAKFYRIFLIYLTSNA